MPTPKTTRRHLIATMGAATAASVAGCVGGIGDGNPEDNEPEDDNNNNGLPEPRDPEVDSIAADPTDIPDPVDWDEPRHHEWEIQTEEYIVEIEPDVTHQMMTFEGQVPGPLYRARVGDSVTLTFDVPESLNADVHNIDFHAVYGPGGGAVDTTVDPGDGPAEIEFTLEYPGAHIYHCAPGSHDHHISAGMFGAIIVEPEEGLPPVDREFYFGQHELYTRGNTGETGHHGWNFEASMDEDPTYVLLNGEVGRYVQDGTIGPLHAETGETVRVFWANGGPNLVSGPHPIGNVWSRWYASGDLLSDPQQYVEGAPLPAGVTAVGEMELPVPGMINFVDHALSRVVHKGLLAQLMVEGEEDPDIFNPSP